MTPTPKARALAALVVDDSRTMRQQICWALQRSLGISPVEAADGAEGWKKLADGAFDIVLTDVNMPVLDGLKLISMIRAGDRTRDVPVVVITTERGEAERARALGMGADAYLVKPVRAQQIVAKVKELLGLP
jgi:two-component system chemotaxis response regulator CheY